jgi:DNA modification methylase
MTDSRFQIIQGDVIEVLRTLPDQFVHCCITSPPYWGLRDYGTGTWEGGDPACDHKIRYDSRADRPLGKLHGGHETIDAATAIIRDQCPKCGARRVDKQIGLERTVDEYVAKMVDVFREVRRVLRPDGTLWLNLGDSYCSTIKGSGGHSEKQDSNAGSRFAPRHLELTSGLKPKDLAGVPWRTALALQADGWWLRCDVVWEKSNSLPHSVRDRPTRSHEYVFLLAKNRHYYYDADAIKEDCVKTGTPGHLQGGAGERAGTREGLRGRTWDPAEGRNRRSVWTIPTYATPEAHFACVDDQTEALTTSGWKRHSELTDGDVIAAFNGRSLLWRPALFSRFPYSGDVISVETRDLSMALTPNHRIVYRRRHPRPKRDWSIIRAEDLRMTHEVPTAATLGEFGKMFVNLALAELCGWAVSDGHYARHGGRVIIYQSEGRGTCERLDRLFQILGISPSLYKRQRAHLPERTYGFNGFAADFIRSTFVAKGGNYSVLRQWPRSALAALWLGMVGGDGSIRSDGRVTFEKTEEVCGFFQALSAVLGKTCRVSWRHGKAWSAFVSHKNSVGMRNSHGSMVRKAHYEGTVWCPSVEGGMWLARRKGKPFITGNTFPVDLPELCIRAGSPEDGVVLDPFSGAATTGLACLKTNRRYLGIELNPEYIDMAFARARKYYPLLLAA